MTLRGRWQNATLDDPLGGCADSTRRFYALIVAEPGIVQTAAGNRCGLGSADGAVSTLVSRNLIEVRRSAETGAYRNYLWPVPR